MPRKTGSMKSKSAKMTVSRIAQLTELVRASLLGQRCWYVSAGAISTTFQLALGKPIRRKHPLKNKTHSRKYRNYEGTANVLVLCSWCLEFGRKVLTSSNDLMSRAEKGLSGLDGSLVVNITLAEPAWDLTVEFDCGRVLRLFSNGVRNRENTGYNWYLFVPGGVITAGPGSALVYEQEDHGDNTC
jgi:hypothetical protein